MVGALLNDLRAVMMIFHPKSANTIFAKCRPIAFICCLLNSGFYQVSSIQGSLEGPNLDFLSCSNFFSRTTTVY